MVINFHWGTITLIDEPLDIEKIRQAGQKKILFLSHAIRQMARVDSMISATEIKVVLEKGEVIEAYPTDQRGPSCLMMGYVSNRPLHFVCSPKDEYLAIITAYIPNESQWDASFKKRKP